MFYVSAVKTEREDLYLSVPLKSFDLQWKINEFFEFVCFCVAASNKDDDGEAIFQPRDSGYACWCSS